ncbi:hypothetical protein BH23VER1_BH23VER1_05340 [soil metagenome]
MNPTRPAARRPPRIPATLAATVAALATVACLCLAAAHAQVLPDPAAERISDLESQLGRSLPTSPGAAEAMLDLIELYAEHGHAFGLVRTTGTFVAAQPDHPDHRRGLSTRIDALKSTSRHPEIQAAARQFTERYPDGTGTAHAWRSLAESLAASGSDDRPAIASAFENARAAAGSRDGFHDGILSIHYFTEHNDASSFAAAARVARSMLADLPDSPAAIPIGLEGFRAALRSGDPELAAALGQALLSLPGKIDPTRLASVCAQLGETFHGLDRHDEAATNFRRSLALRQDPDVHLGLIRTLIDPAKLAPVVAEFESRFPDHPHRWTAVRQLADRHVEAEQLAEAVRLAERIATGGGADEALLRKYLGWLEASGQPLARAEKFLTTTAAKLPPESSWHLRWVLAFDLYRDRMEQPDRAASVARTMLFDAPADTSDLGGALTWLLGQDSWKSDLDRYLKTAASRPHASAYRNLLTHWIKHGDADRTSAATARYQAFLDSPTTKLWRDASSDDRNSAAQTRAQLLARSDLTTDQRLLALGAQAYHFRNHVGDGERHQSVPLYSDLARQHAPDDYEVARTYLEAAASYGTPEQKLAALTHVLGSNKTAPFSDGPTFHRLVAIASGLEDAVLARRALAWIKATEAAHSPTIEDAGGIGDHLANAGLESDAVAYWQSHLPVDRDHRESQACASKLLGQIEPPADRIAFLNSLLEPVSDHHGAYASWLADEHLKAGDLGAFETTLRTARQRQDARPFQGWGFPDDLPASWIRIAQDSESDLSHDDRRRILTAVANLDHARPSAAASLALLALLALDPDTPTNGLARLVACYEATRLAGRHSHSWDWLRPYAQRSMADGRTGEAAALWAGLIHNVGSVGADTLAEARSQLRTAYVQLGALGLEVDPDSPVAPLMEIGLHLRVGDADAAAATYRANRALFDAHRGEIPTDIVLFAARIPIDEATDESYARAEDILRSWLIAADGDALVPPADRARVQLLLGGAYQRALRFDVARSEFTSVINQFPDTPEATEARFGTAESFMEQKVYDEAETLLAELAASPLPAVSVRAGFLGGVLAVRQGDLDAARSRFRTVLQSLPDTGLADRTLFELAEVYGLEQRYLEQLQLLRTVGRLGRESERYHTPGKALSIVIQDVDLGISRGNSRIPVLLSTDPGGDEETVYLTAGGAGKGLFLGEIDTALGAARPGDSTLQVLGADTITIRYPGDFTAEFGSAPPPGSAIRIASDATFAMASSLIDDPADDPLHPATDPAKSAAQRAIEALLQADRRPPDQIKPGNLIHFRVSDPDRSLTAEIDEIPVMVVAASGDAVQATLVETGADTGVFRGQLRTAQLPAGASASDSAIGHSPLMAIDSDPASTWRSEPDGLAPKHLTIDMKDVHPVDSITLSTPSPERQAPTRFGILGSHDGRFFYTLASFPEEENPPTKPAGGFGQMALRSIPVDDPTIDRWDQVVALAESSDAPPEPVSDAGLTWPPPGTESPAAGARALLWQGLIAQPRAGAVRIALSGFRTALMVDGQLVIPPTPGDGSADLFLSAGTHELSMLITVRDASNESATALIARENPNSPAVRLVPFAPADFPAPGQLEPATLPTPAKVTANEAGDRWEISLPSTPLRHIRFRVDAFQGETVAINAVTISGSEGTPIPPGTDLLALAHNDTLEIAPGDTLTGTYVDQLTAGGDGRNRPLTQTMHATYSNGSVVPLSHDFLRAADGSVQELRKEILRIDPGERLIIEVTDYDLDRTGQPDSVAVTAAATAATAAATTLQAEETGPSTGVFHAELDTVPLGLAPGDTFYLRYEDTENTFPGHRIHRETPVFVRTPTHGQIRIVGTALSDDGAPTYSPAGGTPPKGIDYSLPLIVEVIDPDAARDSRSTILVEISVADRDPVSLECRISNDHADNQAAADGLANPALHAGRFVGQIRLQLGGAASPPSIPATDPGAIDSLIPVLNVTGGDTIRVTYHDADPAGMPPATDLAQLATSATLAVTDPAGELPADILHLGERLHLRLADPDLDTTDERDSATVLITTESGEREVVSLSETLAHSGIFTGSFPLLAAGPTPSNLDPRNPAIEAAFGDTLTVTHEDTRPSGAGDPLTLTHSLPVAAGADGLATAFGKVFSDEELAVQTQFTIAESYFELFKSHRSLDRIPEAQADLEAGRRTLNELQDDYPAPRYVPRVAYLLGQFSQELGDWDSAIASYTTIARDHPEHTLAPDAHYKLGQCYEEAARFDEALDTYVGLAATYPESPLIASVMIRITDRYYKDEEYLAAAGVGEKFLERFASHQWAPRIAFRVGQCYFKAERFAEAGTSFDDIAKRFPDDEFAPQSLFWAGESYRMASDVPHAFRRYNRCRWDYPESDAAKYARGRLALPEMLAQFEREAESAAAE